MTAFLWTVVVFGVLEAACTVYYAAKGTPPVRTVAGMVVNGLLMFSAAMWAFWLLAHS